jgi:hypothetical protein
MADNILSFSTQQAEQIDRRDLALEKIGIGLEALQIVNDSGASDRRKGQHLNWFIEVLQSQQGQANDEA